MSRSVANDVWISLDVGQESNYAVARSEYEKIDHAYRQWIEEKKDSVLELQGLIGTDMVVAASKIVLFSLNTPEGRAEQRALNKQVDDEAPPE